MQLMTRWKSMIRQKGFTLLEVLVAVLVLAIGLLGLAGLQATSLRVNQSASMRSQATNLAYDMADRIRANRGAALAGSYDSQALATTPPACAVITLNSCGAGHCFLAQCNCLYFAAKHREYCAY